MRALARPSPNSTAELSDNANPSIDKQKAGFSAAASEYFARLYSIDVGLRTQIHALEEAKIIFTVANYQPSAATDGGKDGSAAAKAAAVSKDAVTGGGLGSLDVGWLNSRNDYVGKQMEAELWKKASDFLAKSELEKIRSINNSSTT